MINIIDLGRPQGRIRRALYKVYFENILPFLGRHIFHRGEFNSFRYLPESNKYFMPPGELQEYLRACGLTGLRAQSYMGGTVIHITGHA